MLALFHYSHGPHHRTYAMLSHESIDAYVDFARRYGDRFFIEWS